MMEKRLVFLMGNLAGPGRSPQLYEEIALPPFFAIEPNPELGPLHPFLGPGEELVQLPAQVPVAEKDEGEKKQDDAKEKPQDPVWKSFFCEGLLGLEFKKGIQGSNLLIRELTVLCFYVKRAGFVNCS
jgi:hypothetical protein